MTPEEWRPVPGWEDLYEVSDFGRVRSLDRMVPNAMSLSGQAMRRGRILRQDIPETGTRAGRPGATLARDGKKATVQVATLVLSAFVGPRPEGQVGCHNDGNPSNNRLSNLRWDTQSGNIQDSIAQGTHREVRKTHCPRGHELALPNLPGTHLRRGHRTCLACQRALNVKRRARLAGQPFDMQKVSDDYYAAIMRVA